MANTALLRKRLFSKASVYLVIILGITLVLRLYHLGKPSLWLDEIGQVLVAKKSFRGILQGVCAHHGAQPLDYMITALFVRFSSYEWVLRLPSAIWGTLSVYYLYRLGAKVRSKETGLLAAFLLSIHPLHLRYSQEVRFYSLFLFFSLFSTVMLFQSWKTSSRKEWSLYAISVTLGLYTHIYMGLVILFHSFWVGSKYIMRDSKESAQHSNTFRFLLSVIVSFIVFIPWLLYSVLREQRTSAFHAPDMTWNLARDVLLQFCGHNSILVYLLGSLALVGLIIVFMSRIDHGLLISLWVIGAFPAVVILDQSYSYFFSIRQMLFVLPIFLLLVAIGTEWVADEVVLHTFKQMPLPRQRQLFVSSILFVSSLLVAIGMRPQIHAYYNQPRGLDWRDIGTLFNNNLSVKDKVVLINVGSYTKYYSPRAVRQSRYTHNLSTVQREYNTNSPIWVLETPYLNQVPDHHAIRNWLAHTPALIFPVGMGANVFYLQKGKNKSDLALVACDFTLPPNKNTLLAYARLMSQYGHWQEAGQAYGTLSKLTRGQKAETEYLYQAGFSFAKIGQSKKVHYYWERYLKLSPTGRWAPLITQHLDSYSH